MKAFLPKARLTAAALGLVVAVATAAASADEAPAPPDKPFLWRVEGNGLQKPSHLFGTIHLSNERIAQLHPVAERAFTAADVLHAEVSLNMADQMGAAVLMMRRDGKKLSESIGPELTEQLKASLQAIQPGLDIAILQPMKTWAAAMIVVMLPHQLKGDQPLDVILWNRAKELEKGTAALETIQDQIDAFETLNEAEQVIYLRETLTTLGEHADLMPRLIAAYETGDDEVMDKLLTESMELGSDDAQVREISKRLMNALLTARDVTLAAKIHEVLTANPEKSHFFAVGAAHYLGDNSIRKHLADQGYTLTRITE